MMALELVGIAKAFGGVQAVTDVSFRCEPGRITALVGPNGAGKTTLFNLISGLLLPDAGTISYRGKRIDGLPPWAVARHGIGRLFQDVRVFGRMSVLDNVRAAFPDQLGERVWNTVLRRRRVREQEHAITARAMELLEAVGVAEGAALLSGNLSFGQQKLVALARLLAADAQVLLLDEPTAGVAPHLVERLLATISTIASAGKAILLIEHDMRVVAKTADHVYFMDKGRVISAGIPGEVLEDPGVRAAYLGVRTMS